VVRLYGLENRGRAPEQPSKSLSPITDLVTEQAIDPRAQQRGTAGQLSVSLWGTRWEVTLLAEQAVYAPGPIQLSALPPPNLGEVAVECSRAATEEGDPAPTGRKGRCAKIRFLGDPTGTAAYGKPQEIPKDRRTRAALGTISIDARGLAPGYYLLPTHDYNFLKVTGSDGTPIRTYLFNSRPLIRHFGGNGS